VNQLSREGLNGFSNNNNNNTKIYNVHM